MNNILKKIGIGTIAVAIFIVGYSIGRTPTTAEQNQAKYMVQYTSDIQILGNDYKAFGGLCEQKYTAAFQGNINEAYRLKGQMDLLTVEIQNILGKYQTKGI